jgi:hypothetical protein
MLFRRTRDTATAFDSSDVGDGLSTTNATTGRLFRSSELTVDFNLPQPSMSSSVDASRYLPTQNQVIVKGSLGDRMLNLFADGGPIRLDPGIAVREGGDFPRYLPNQPQPIPGFDPIRAVDGITISGKYYTWEQLGQVSTPSSKPIDIENSARATRFSAYEDIVGIGDFNGDTFKDSLIHNRQTGELTIWYMNNANKLGEAPVIAPGVTSHTVVGIGDMDGNGTQDIVWRENSGANPQVVVWLMNNYTVTASAALPFFNGTGAAWQIDSIADFNNDGRADFLWRNYQTGQSQTWNLGGITSGGNGSFVPVSSTPSATWLAGGTVVTADWKIVGTGDVNLDGTQDVFWRNSTYGWNAIWTMGNNYQTITSAPNLVQLAPSSGYQATTIGDINADGRADWIWKGDINFQGYSAWLTNPTASNYVAGTPTIPGNSNDSGAIGT